LASSQWPHPRRGAVGAGRPHRRRVPQLRGPRRPSRPQPHPFPPPLLQSPAAHHPPRCGAFTPSLASTDLSIGFFLLEKYCIAGTRLSGTLCPPYPQLLLGLVLVVFSSLLIARKSWMNANRIQFLSPQFIFLQFIFHVRVSITPINQDVTNTTKTRYWNMSRSEYSTLTNILSQFSEENNRWGKRKVMAEWRSRLDVSFRSKVRQDIVLLFFRCPAANRRQSGGQGRPPRSS